MIGDPPLLDFFVEGAPQTAGSKRAFVNPKTGKAIVTEDAKGDTGQRKKSWREDVREAARKAIGEADGFPLDCALSVSLTFYRRRPKGHFGTGRNAGVVKDSAPAFPTTRPDVLKLSRAVEDACTAIVYHDDSAIVAEHLYKRWGEREGVQIVVRRLDGRV